MLIHLTVIEHVLYPRHCISLAAKHKVVPLFTEFKEIDKPKCGARQKSDGHQSLKEGQGHQERNRHRPRAMREDNLSKQLTLSLVRM